MNDRRLTPANGRVAASHLRGQIQAESFTHGTTAQVIQFQAGLYATPEGALDRQLLFGDDVTVFESHGGWSFVQSAKDGYCGYVPAVSLAEPVAATHAVCLRQTHIYPPAGFKAPPLLRLPFGARVCVTGQSGNWTEIAWSGGTGILPQTHLRDLAASLRDPAGTAALFLGTPYLWAGNTGDGIDCSGLVQAACLAAGLPCRGDSDQQAQTLGTVIDDADPLRRNDLLFWNGHVALVESPQTMIHATAFAMAVIREDIASAIARIHAAGDGEIIARRRLLL